MYKINHEPPPVIIFIVDSFYSVFDASLPNCLPFSESDQTYNYLMSSIILDI